MRLRDGDDATTLRASAGMGIKEPSFLESYGESFFAKGNPDLDPERSTTFDVGVEQRLFGSRLRASVGAFHNDYRDQIAYTVVDFDTFEGSYVNLAHTRAQGIEVALEARPITSLHLFGQYTYLDSEILESPSDFDPVYAEGEPLLRRPRHQGSLSAQLSFARWSAGATLVRVGERADSDFVGLGLTRSEAYTRLDARAARARGGAGRGVRDGGEPDGRRVPGGARLPRPRPLRPRRPAPRVGRAQLRRLVGAFLLALLLAAPAAPAAEAPLRVASLNLTADELLVEMLPADRLVAVTRWADDADMSNVAGRVPATAVRLPRADLERIIALRPDLVVVSEYTDADFLRLVEKSGLRYHRMSGLDTLPGIRAAIVDLGRAVGTPGAAARLTARFDAVLAELARRLEGDPRPRVLYWGDPHTAGAGTAIGSLVEAAGATNVGRELGLRGIVPIAGEKAFAAEPDAFLVTQGSGASVALRRHPLLSRTRAVREGRVVEMPNRLLVALSDRAADAAWWLASRLHPARVPEAAPPPKLP